MKVKDHLFEKPFKYTIRSARPDSQEAGWLLDYLVKVHNEAYEFLNQNGEHFRNFPVEEEVKIIKDFIENKHRFLLVAVRDEKAKLQNFALTENPILGCLGFVGQTFPYGQHAGSLGMSVHSDFSRMGIGTKLINVCLKSLKENDFKKVSLTVRTHNHKAIALYEKFGFRRVGILEKAALINGAFFDEYSYEKLL